MGESPSWPPTEFIGREEELTTLRAVLDEARGGRGGIVLVVGEPGIGKTRMAEELAAEARLRSARVLWGRAFEDDAAPAFWPWIQVLRPLAAAAALPPADPDAADLARLLPELRAGQPDLPLPPRLSPVPARFRLFESVAALLKAAAEREPLVLIFDDLHWADPPSLLLLRHVARDAPTRRLLIVGAYREGEVGRHHPLAATVAELLRDRRTHHLALPGLGEPEVARFVELTAGREARRSLIEAVTRETEGNPFFVGEVVRLLLSEGRLDDPGISAAGKPILPPSVREVIGQRLARLSKRCREILTVAAIVGKEFSLRILAEASHRTTSRLLAALDEAQAAQLVVALPGTPGGFAFRHALIRATLEADLMASDRIRLHRRVGEALEAFYRADVEGHLAELAHHFVQAAAAGDARRSVDYARRAGERATALLAYEEAAEHFERALRVTELQAGELPSRCRLLLLLGDARRKSGEPGRAVETFRQAAALAKQLGAAELLATAALGVEDTVLAAGLTRLRVADPSVELLQEALARQGDGPSAVKAKMLAALARALWFSVAPDRGAELSRQAVEMARAAADPTALAYALNTRRMVLRRADDLAERLAITREIVQLAQDLGDPELELEARHGRQHALLEQLDVAPAELAVEAASFARLADELRLPAYRCYVPFFRASQALLVGQFARAEAQADEGLSLGRRGQSQNAEQIHLALLLMLRREQGRLAELEAVVDDSVARYPLALIYGSLRAWLFAELGRDAEARAAFEQLAVGDFAVLRQSYNLLPNAAFLAQVCAFLGDRHRADTLAGLLAPYATYWVIGGSVGPWWGAAAHYLGLLAATRERREEAIAHLAAAHERCARVGARPWLARTAYDLARVLVRRAAPGDRERAANLLGQSLATARELAMTPLLRQALGFAEQAGLAPPTPADPAGGDSGSTVVPPPHPGDLSPREVEVLRLLAAGYSNKEIAASLVLSVRTVEHHVAHIYAKIGARGRVEATALAIRHGVIPTALARR